MLTGADHGPPPVEYLLHALAGCLTAGIVNIAAARGVRLTAVTSTVEGDIDLLGVLGLSDGAVRNGYRQITAEFHIEGDADEETLARHRRAVPAPVGGVRRADQPDTGLHRGHHRLSRPNPTPTAALRPGRRSATTRAGAQPEGAPWTHIDTVIIGAGHAGLAVSRLLTEAGRDHVVLERGRVAERWRSERWDSLHLLTPNWMTRLPGLLLRGARIRTATCLHAQLVRHLEAYAASFRAPVLTDSTVVRGGRRRRRLPGRHRPRQLADPVRGHRHGTGGAARTLRCPLGRLGPGRPRRCRRPRTATRHLLPAGGVLVVGASSSGVQIADELARAGREVVLAVGRHTRVPRRYRGMDIFWWLERTGRLARTIDEVADVDAARREPSLQLVGRGAGDQPRRGPGPGHAAGPGASGSTGRVAGIDGTAVQLLDDLRHSIE